MNSIHYLSSRVQEVFAASVVPGDGSADSADQENDQTTMAVSDDSEEDNFSDNEKLRRLSDDYKEFVDISAITETVNPQIESENADFTPPTPLLHRLIRFFLHQLVIARYILLWPVTWHPEPTSTPPTPLSPSNSPPLLRPPRRLFPCSKPHKTLILDLDETLIHSLARETRISTGHMVEVKLPNSFAALYYVHKRPHCDAFLRHVATWFRLVVFTAGVREYADPVIDWLETEMPLGFHKRFYRDDCQYDEKAGGYIKDVSLVESDLSRVCIVDNSPICYSKHVENAIMVRGWISDPKDSDLLHLLPLLNALRYVEDVRSVLGLKRGEEWVKMGGEEEGEG